MSVSALSKDCFNAGLDPPEVGFETGGPSVEEKCPVCVAVLFHDGKLVSIGQLDTRR